MINPECRKNARIGFPFFGEESTTLSRLVKNHEKTGLGYDHLTKQIRYFQNAKTYYNKFLVVDEKLYDDYRKMNNSESWIDFILMDIDKD